VAVRFGNGAEQKRDGGELMGGKAAVWGTAQTVPAGAPLSQPYWLRAEHTTGMYRVDDPALIGRPENPPALPVEHIFEVGGQRLVIGVEPLQVTTNADGTVARQKVEVISPVSLQLSSDVRLFPPGAARPVSLEVTSFRAGVGGVLRLEAPAGWTVTPAKQAFSLKTAGERAQFRFTATAPAKPGTAGLLACAEIDGICYSSRRVEIGYQHIPRQLLQPAARCEAVSLDLAIRGRRVGYVAGAGDSVAASLGEMGYEVVPLAVEQLTPERLRGLDAVVLGIRALNVRHELASQMPALFSFAEAGGNLVIQYNNPNGLPTNAFAPFDLRVSPERVTDENAPVTFLAPDHPALNTPNKITGADFAGWVQERGLYYPNRWDDRFIPVLACGDPGESPLRGGLLVADYGRGHVVYTGLAFFRQLPAGVPGAYRLFANLVSLGK
jgi:hypothetical protein